jgi:hypothetical protein
VTPGQLEQLDVLARDSYRDHPAARALLEVAIYAEDEERRIRAAAALTALDPSNPVPEIQRRALVRSERGALRLVEPEPADRGPRPWIQPARDFLAVREEPLTFAIGELVPAGCISLWHGEPRVRKTWAGLELALAKATGTPAFGLPRFAVDEAGPAAYFSQEDSAPRVRDRLRRLLAGRRITAAPELLHVSVHAGIDLEREDCQETLVRDVRRLGLQLVVFDPVRRFAPSADKGPSEVSCVTGILRRLASETGAAVVILHHDVKPARDGRDDRRRSHRASGGDWFAAADAPIALEAAGTVTVAYPEDFKHGADPRPFRFRVVDAAEGSGLLLAGEDIEAGTDSKDLALQERILNFLAEHPRVSTRKVEAGIKGASNRGVRDALDVLLGEGKVDRIEGPKRSWLWWVSAS